MPDVSGMAAQNAEQSMNETRRNIDGVIQRLIANNTRYIIQGIVRKKQAEKEQDPSLEDDSYDAERGDVRGFGREDAEGLEKPSVATERMEADDLEPMSSERSELVREFKDIEAVAKAPEGEKVDLADSLADDFADDRFARGDSRFTDSLKETFDKVKTEHPELGSICDKANEALSELTESTEELQLGLSREDGGLLKPDAEFSGKPTEGWDGIKEGLTDKGQMLVDRIREAGEKLSDIVKENKELLIPTAGLVTPEWRLNPADKITELYEKIQNTLGDRGVDIFERSDEAYGKLQKTFKEQFGIKGEKPLSEEIGELTKSAGEQGCDAKDIEDLNSLQGYAKSTEDSFASLKETLRTDPNDKEKIEGVLGKLRESVNDLKEKGKEFLKRDGKDSRQLMEKLAKDSSKLAESGKKLAEGVTKAAPQAVKEVKQMAERIEKVIKLVKEAIKRTIQAATTAAANSNPYSAAAKKAVEIALKEVEKTVKKTKEAKEKSEKDAEKTLSADAKSETEAKSDLPKTELAKKISDKDDLSK